MSLPRHEGGRRGGGGHVGALSSLHQLPPARLPRLPRLPDSWVPDQRRGLPGEPAEPWPSFTLWGGEAGVGWGIRWDCSVTGWARVQRAPPTPLRSSDLVATPVDGDVAGMRAVNWLPWIFFFLTEIKKKNSSKDKLMVHAKKWGRRNESSSRRVQPAERGSISLTLVEAPGPVAHD